MPSRALGDFAQNGIQMGWGAIGDVKFIEGSHNWYDAADWVASGILIFQSEACMVHGNVLYDNQVGVAIETWGWLGTVSASYNRIARARLFRN